MESESVRDLRSSPLLLALMCILYRGEGSIPRNRCDVYDRCADLLFRRWDSHRRIHMDLKVAQGSDAAVRRILQHLAYWLLTRDSTESAVTERQLVAETAHYLADRSDSVAQDEALEGAEEFVEFCRGRAWVFTDVGTTKEGENLYTFTHRTFLEFFAARYLSLANDTPERLARALAPRVARHEWPVVAPLAIQIKDQSVDRGAERLLLALLGDGRRRTPGSRLRILSLIAECLPWATLPGDAVSRLVSEIIEATPLFLPNERRPDLALGLLLTNCWLVRDAVRTALVATIDEMVSSRDAKVSANGIRLALSLHLGRLGRPGRVDDGWRSTELEGYWREVQTEIIRKYRVLVLDLAARDAGVFCALQDTELISEIPKLLKSFPDISPCFVYGDLGVFPGCACP